MRLPPMNSVQMDAVERMIREEWAPAALNFTVTFTIQARLRAASLLCALALTVPPPRMLAAQAKRLQADGSAAVTSTDAAANPWWGAFTASLAAQGLSVAPEIFPAATDASYLRVLGIPSLGFSPMRRARRARAVHLRCVATADTVPCCGAAGARRSCCTSTTSSCPRARSRRASPSTSASSLTSQTLQARRAATMSCRYAMLGCACMPHHARCCTRAASSCLACVAQPLRALSSGARPQQQHRPAFPQREAAAVLSAQRSATARPAAQAQSRQPCGELRSAVRAECGDAAAAFARKLASAQLAARNTRQLHSHGSQRADEAAQELPVGRLGLRAAAVAASAACWQAAAPRVPQTHDLREQRGARHLLPARVAQRERQQTDVVERAARTGRAACVSASPLPQ